MYYYKSEQNFEKVAGPQTVTLPKMSSITSISILFVQVSIFLLILNSDVYYVTQGNFFFTFHLLQLLRLTGQMLTFYGKQE